MIRIQVINSCYQKAWREEKLPLSMAVEKPKKYDEGGSHWK